jgi:hypothetical protein
VTHTRRFRQCTIGNALYATAAPATAWQRKRCSRAGNGLPTSPPAHLAGALACLVLVEASLARCEPVVGQASSKGAQRRRQAGIGGGAASEVVVSALGALLAGTRACTVLVCARAANVAHTASGNSRQRGWNSRSGCGRGLARRRDGRAVRCAAERLMNGSHSSRTLMWAQAKQAASRLVQHPPVAVIGGEGSSWAGGAASRHAWCGGICACTNPDKGAGGCSSSWSGAVLAVLAGGSLLARHAEHTAAPNS